ncbi:hypothetical protein [Marivirga arenosa]|uniref:Uncharacterized protein n=1 Tax=Marivirga arenosa TaxID=3059076 RepID=A0AA51X3F2_9BACT|nr:hypothetical protein [Marivirga sp. BKB1-2]WNB16896.1 hypothetical protein QYS47_32160 [Marivirga sp. BKB1-2]
MELFNLIITTLSVYSPVLFFITLFITKNENYLDIDKILITLVSVAFISDISLKYFIEGRNYIYIFIYMLVESVLILIFYQKILNRKRNIILGLSLIYLVSIILELFYKNPVNDFFSYSLTVKNFIYIILALFYFIEIYRYEKDIFNKEAPQFSYNVGILIYASLAFFPVFLATELMSGFFDFSLWYIHNIGNILKNIIFAVGLWLVQKR